MLSQTLDLARAEVIYHGLYVPSKGDRSFTLSATIDSLVEASKAGRAGVAIIVK